MLGQGYDAQINISGSLSGFVNIVHKGQKYNISKRKILIKDNQGNVVGYKYPDQTYEELQIEWWVEGTTGNTGTLQFTAPAIGTTTILSNAIDNNITGSYSLDKWDSNGAADDTVKTGTATISRYSGITLV